MGKILLKLLNLNYIQVVSYWLYFNFTIIILVLRVILFIFGFEFSSLFLGIKSRAIAKLELALSSMDGYKSLRSLACGWVRSKAWQSPAVEILQKECVYP